jgi:hypothetical protein
MNESMNFTAFLGNHKIYNPVNNSAEINPNIYSSIRTLVVFPNNVSKVDYASDLGKIMSACRLQPMEYAVINQDPYWINFRSFENIKEVLLLGATEETVDINITLPLNQVKHFDERVWIKTHSIIEIMANQAYKNALWTQALKPHFVQ